MKLGAGVALRIPTGRPVEPFGDLPGDLPVLNRPLREVQEAALRAAGLELVAEAPKDRPYLLFSDRCWFTAEALRRLVAGAPGRLCIDDPDWLRMATLCPDPRRPELAWCPAGHPPSFAGLPDSPAELGLSKVDPPMPHPAFAHAMGGRWVGGRALAHDLDHWFHLARVNLFALAAVGAEAHATFESASIPGKIALALPVLWRARSLSPAAIGRAVSRIGPGCRIHPTAVIEASELGRDVTVGAHAVVQGSVVGDGATVDAQAWVVASVVGPRAMVGRAAGVALCVLMEGAFVSWGPGRQLCVFGRDSFLAQDCTIFDLSFGGEIKVEHHGERVSSGGHFLGAAVGHRARIGAAAVLGYGAAVPNDAFLVAPADRVLRRWPEPIAGAAMVVDGVARPAKG